MVALSLFMVSPAFTILKLLTRLKEIKQNLIYPRQESSNWVTYGICHRFILLRVSTFQQIVTAYFVFGSFSYPNRLKEAIKFTKNTACRLYFIFNIIMFPRYLVQESNAV